MASRVRPVLTDAEFINIFMITLQGMYYKKMVGSLSSKFSDILTIGERIENGMKIGKISSVDNQTMVKKYQGFSKKIEAKESAMIENVYP